MRGPARLAALGLALALVGCVRYAEVEAPAGRDAVRVVTLGEGAADVEALGDAMTAEVAAVLPGGSAAGVRPEDAGLFVRFHRDGAEWSRPSLANAFDFSGIGWGGAPIVTLVTDRHVVFSAHVPLEAGRTLHFARLDGEVVERRLAEKLSVPVLEPEGVSIDLAVGRLDLPVPEGIAVYPMPSTPPGLPPDATVDLRGEDVPVVTTYQGRSATIGTLARTSDDGLRVVYAKGSRRLGLPEAAGRAVAWGDSGHPSFHVVDGELVLASHFHTDEGAGAGPNYADPRVRRAVTAAVEALGG